MIMFNDPDLCTIKPIFIYQENQIDDLIRNTELEFKLLNQDKQYAYVSYQVSNSV